MSSLYERERYEAVSLMYQTQRTTEGVYRDVEDVIEQLRMKEVEVET